MTSMPDMSEDERNRLKQEYIELEEKYKRMTWTVVELGHDLGVRDDKLDKIRDIVTGKVKHPQEGIVMAEYELDAIRKIIVDEFTL